MVVQFELSPDLTPQQKAKAEEAIKQFEAIAKREVRPGAFPARYTPTPGVGPFGPYTRKSKTAFRGFRYPWTYPGVPHQGAKVLQIVTLTFALGTVGFVGLYNAFVTKPHTTASEWRQATDERKIGRELYLGRAERN